MNKWIKVTWLKYFKWNGEKKTQRTGLGPTTFWIRDDEENFKA